MGYLVRRVFFLFIAGCVALALVRVAFADPKGGFEWAKAKASQVAEWAQGVGQSVQDKAPGLPDLPVIIPSATPAPSVSGQVARKHGGRAKAKPAPSSTAAP